MANRYHINPDGDPGLCKAKKGQCPFGDADQHFSTRDEARAAYESEQSSFPMPTREEMIEKFSSIYKTVGEWERFSESRYYCVVKLKRRRGNTNMWTTVKEVAYGVDASEGRAGVHQRVRATRYRVLAQAFEDFAAGRIPK